MKTAFDEQSSRLGMAEEITSELEDILIDISNMKKQRE